MGHLVSSSMVQGKWWMVRQNRQGVHHWKMPSFVDTGAYHSVIHFWAWGNHSSMVAEASTVYHSWSNQQWGYHKQNWYFLSFKHHPWFMLICLTVPNLINVSDFWAVSQKRPPKTVELWCCANNVWETPALVTPSTIVLSIWIHPQPPKKRHKHVSKIVQTSTMNLPTFPQIWPKGDHGKVYIHDLWEGIHYRSLEWPLQTIIDQCQPLPPFTTTIKHSHLRSASTSYYNYQPLSIIIGHYSSLSSRNLDHHSPFSTIINHPEPLLPQLLTITINE